jgi:outer membrane murein-binding lipoprotein Lpp
MLQISFSFVNWFVCQPHRFRQLILCLLLAACTPETEVPTGTLSEAKMAQLLSQIHLIEARVSRLSMASLDSTALVTERLKRDMFKKNQIDTAAYNRSYKFYSTHPEYFERIYEQVAKDLENRVKKDDIRGL